MFRKITVAFDESPEAGRALETGVELAESLHASPTAVSVIQPAPIYFTSRPWLLLWWVDEMPAKYIALRAKAREFAEGAGLAIEGELSNGDEVESIRKAAKHHQADLLVIGMPKHNWIVGHTAQEVAERVPCALLGIRYLSSQGNGWRRAI